MSGERCDLAVPFPALVDWWFDERDEGEDGSAGHALDEHALDEHVLACGACAARLQWLADVTDEAGAMITDARGSSVVPGPLIDRLSASGMRIREYRMDPGGSVDCTIAPDDDLLCARLSAPLAGVTRLDVIPAEPGGAERRLEDVPFDARTGEVVIVPPTAAMRSLETAVATTRLIAVERDGRERVIGDYTFRHRRWPGGPG